jgi:hypothetical protein
MAEQLHALNHLRIHRQQDLTLVTFGRFRPFRMVFFSSDIGTIRLTSE